MRCMPDRIIRIAHISDTHITNYGMHVPRMLERCIEILNSMDPRPDVVIHSGDLTDNGILMDYELAVERMREIRGFGGFRARLSPETPRGKRRGGSESSS